MKSLEDRCGRQGGARAAIASTDEAARISLVAGVTADLTSRVKAGEIVGAVAAQVGGKGA